MALATESVAATMMMAMMLGRIWRHMMLLLRTPTLTAASTNSFCLSESTEPRTMRAVGIQPKIPMIVTTMTNAPISRPKRMRSGSRKSDIATSSSGICGRVSIMSVKRMRMLSSLPM